MYDRTEEGWLTLFKPLEWAKDAACKGMNTETFFPERGASRFQINAIKKLCNSCPVQQECLEYGWHELHGWWGGQSVRERQHARTGRAYPYSASV